MGCARSKPEIIFPTEQLSDIRKLILEEELSSSQYNKHRLSPHSNAKVLKDTDAKTAKISNPAKSLSDEKLIKGALANHFIFNSLTKEDFQVILEEMKLYSLKHGQVVFSQGDPGNKFFVVNSGQVKVVINGTVKSYLHKGSSFGELALMHDSVRTATIETIGNTSLWAINGIVFRAALRSIKAKEVQKVKEFIEKVPVLQVLTTEQKDILLSLFVSLKYQDGQEIVGEGDPGDTFYIITKGKVACSFQGCAVRIMLAGEFFGEQSLLYNTERTATVTAVGKCSLLSLGREDLVVALGGQLEQVIYKNSLKIALDRQNLLHGLTKEQLDRAIDAFNLLYFAEGETVIPPNTSFSRNIWVVLKGELVASNSGHLIGALNCLGSMDFGERISVKPFTTKASAVVAHVSMDKVEACIGGPYSQVIEENAKLKVLQTVPLFGSLPDSVLKTLASVLKVKEYLDLDMIFTQGTEGNALLIVKEGQVEIMKNGHWIRTIQKLDYFGERALLLGEERTADAVAKKNVQCWVLSKEDFFEFLDETTRLKLEHRIVLQNDEIQLEDLGCIGLLGKGMFGNVFLTMHKPGTH